METEINGNIFITEIKTQFTNRIKSGLKFAINVEKSEKSVVTGLERLKVIKNNQIYIGNNNYPKTIDTSLRNYSCKISLCVINNEITIKSINIIEVLTKPYNDKINKPIYLSKYRNKNKIIDNIIRILKET